MIELLITFKAFEFSKYVKVNFEIIAEVTSDEAHDSHPAVETPA